MFFSRSERNSSMGLNSVLSPLARMWARYLFSLERRATAYLEERLKFFMMTRRNSYSRERDSCSSVSRLTLEMSTSAK